MKRTILIFFTLCSFFISCKKNLPDPGGTSVQQMANEWWVTYTVNGSDVLGIGHIRIATFNSSANNNELWIDDMGNGRAGYSFKVKTTADVNALSFSGNSAANEYYSQGGRNPQTVTISGGKILPGAAHARSGNVTDSIYMQATIGGVAYTISGYARTRWPEDDF